MSEPQIGQWAKRRGQKWHLVDSIVAGDIVTRCGRRMDYATFQSGSAGELQVSGVMPLTRMIGQPQNCRLCDRGNG